MNSLRSKEPTEPTSPSSAPTSSDTDAAPDREDCTNCGAELTHTYCGVCGQRAANRIVPLWQVTNEFLEDLFDLDLRILRTFPVFFFRPGRLTVEYVHGRRRRYIRPLRLYLFSSFLLFTVLAFTNLNGFSFSFGPSTEAARADLEAARMELNALRVELMQDAQASGEARRALQPHTDSAAINEKRSALVASSVNAGLAELDRALAGLEPTLDAPTEVREGPAPPPASLVETVGDLAEGSGTLQPKLMRILHDPGTFLRDMVDRVPYLMFLMVPTFALLLKGLYLRRKRLYLEHLIFALHVHALAFIAFALSAGIGALDWGTSWNLDWWVAAAPFGYLFVAMRRVYGQPVGITAAKAFALLLAYGIILVVAVVLLVMMSVALM